MHRTRNAAYGQPYRGFESLPLRHLIKSIAYEGVGDTGGSIGDSAPVVNEPLPKLAQKRIYNPARRQ